MHASAASGDIVCAAFFNLVVALDAGTGQRLWQYEVFRSFTAQSKITIGDGRIYLGQNNFVTVALNATTGKELWRQSFARWQGQAAYLPTGRSTCQPQISFIHSCHP